VCKIGENFTNIQGLLKKASGNVRGPQEVLRICCGRLGNVKKKLVDVGWSQENFKGC
jgi:hypothetical protein